MKNFRLYFSQKDTKTLYGLNYLETIATNSSDKSANLISFPERLIVVPAPIHNQLYTVDVSCPLGKSDDAIIEIKWSYSLRKNCTIFSKHFLAL